MSGTPLPVEPDAMQATVSGAHDIVQQRVADIHGFFGPAVGSTESGRKDKRERVCPGQTHHRRRYPGNIRLETGCLYFGPLHAGRAVGEQAHMKALGQICEKGQHIGIWLAAVVTAFANRSWPRRVRPLRHRGQTVQEFARHREASMASAAPRGRR